MYFLYNTNQLLTFVGENAIHRWNRSLDTVSCCLTDVSLLRSRVNRSPGARCTSHCRNASGFVSYSRWMSSTSLLTTTNSLPPVRWLWMGFKSLTIDRRGFITILLLLSQRLRLVPFVVVVVVGIFSAFVVPLPGDFSTWTPFPFCCDAASVALTVRWGVKPLISTVERCSVSRWLASVALVATGTIPVAIISLPSSQWTEWRITQRVTLFLFQDYPFNYCTRERISRHFSALFTSGQCRTISLVALSFHRRIVPFPRVFENNSWPFLINALFSSLISASLRKQAMITKKDNHIHVMKLLCSSV